MSEPQAPRDGDGQLSRLLETVRTLAAEAHPGSAIPTVTPGTRLDRELGLDSLAMAELLVRVEELFGVSLSDEVLVTAATPHDLLEAAGSAPASTPPSAPSPGAEPGRPTAPAASGPPTSGPPEDAETLVEVLRRHVTDTPDRVHLRILDEAGDVEVTHARLWDEASAVAAGLRERGVAPGDAVALMLPTGRDYFASFAGALLAGAVPAPLYPPARPSQLEEHLRRHVRILDNARAPVLVTTTEVRRLARLVSPQVPSLEHVVTAEEVRGDTEAGGPSWTRTDGEATALLQYTSGSTGDPKGVVLSHANLLANIRAMGRVGDVDPARDVFVSWLPLYHDMGLIGAWLTSMYFGMPLVVMSPLAFLARPVRWLQAIHDHGGTISGGPNFGFELCTRRIGDEQLEGLDLSGWRVAFNGAEPVNPDTLERFAERFAPYGLDRGVLAPVYGLAECSLALTIPPLGRGPVIDRVGRSALSRGRRLVAAPADDPEPARFVSCGRPLPGYNLRVVGPDAEELEERYEGRLQFRGPSATSGYLRNPEATRELFDGDWVETGDLAYVAGGELYPTGRVKDLIIRAGQNLHPAELEDAVAQVEGVRAGCVAAFAARDRHGGTERLVVLAETRATGEPVLEAIRREAAERVTDVAGAPADEVVLVGPGVVPKTSSGKIRRGAARERYEAGRLSVSAAPVWRQVLRLARRSALPRLRDALRGLVVGVRGARAGLVFALAALVVWPLVAVLPGVERRSRLVGRAGWLTARLAAVPVEVHGRERLPVDGPYVVAANHASHLDPLFVTMALPDRAVFSAVGGLAESPWLKVFLRRLDVRLVPRGDRRGGLDVTAALADVVRSGMPVAFFPEGRRSTAPGLERFQMGAFSVAAETGVPVVPVALRGTRDLLPVGGRLPRPGPVTVTIAEPVDTDERGWAGAVELHRAAREAILRHSGEPDAG